MFPQILASQLQVQIWIKQQVKCISQQVEKAAQIDEPVFAAAIPGKTKIPPNIPAILITITDDRPSFLLSFFNFFFAI